jgi:hypothetical protein
MIRDGARSSRRPPPKFEPVQATPRKSPLGKDKSPSVLKEEAGKTPRLQSKGKSRLGGTPVGTPRGDAEKGRAGDKKLEEEDASEDGEGNGEKWKTNEKKKGGGKGGLDSKGTPKSDGGGKGKSTPKGKAKPLPTSKEESKAGENQSPKGKAGTKSGGGGPAAKGAGNSTPKLSDAKENVKSVATSAPSGDATLAADNKRKSAAKPKASPKTEPKPASKSNKQKATPKSEPPKKTSGGAKVEKVTSVAEVGKTEGDKIPKGVKRMLNSTSEPEKKKPAKKARR